jgi:2-keto-4-pentenoate hydratase/2-oxohepta-3-ene-1,7-dioic acid hydratase in catechol pathway
MNAARVLFDGTLTDPQLDHPEGIAVHPRDGSVWCGGERGQIYRLDPEGGTLEQVASTGGFCLGLAFDRDGALFVCDLKHAAVMRMDPSGTVERFADGGDGRRLRVPNFPAFDAHGRLYVSDSHGQHEPGPGIFRFEADGSGTLWYGEPLDFANGLALSLDGTRLYVAETFARRISAIPIEADGGPGPRQTVAVLPGVLPDGLAVDADGRLYVGCYEPSRVLRLAPGGTAEIVADDPEAHLLCHPTNLAFRGRELLTSNLGRWHVTAIEAGVRGAELPPRAAAPPLRPGKIVAIGLNYLDHIREAGVDPPAQPLVFAKFPSTVIGPGDAIVVDPSLTERVDWEVELAVVVGSRMRNVDEAEALDHVLGYTVANDVSARDLQMGDGQWVRGKSLDTFCPLGPVVVPRDEIADPQALTLRTRVNGEVVQESSTREMVFGVAQLLAFCSRSFTLEPGDVLLTGTPWGCGEFMQPRRSLRPGDVVEAEIEGIGVLRNPVVAAEERA